MEDWLKKFTDIEHTSSPISFSPAFEERRAAKYSGVSWTEYAQMTSTEKASVVSYYRLEMSLEYAQAQLKK